MVISVIITAYNTAEYLERAITSVLQQTYRSIEVIVVDDCSTDNTPAILERFCEKDSRVKVITHDTNKGAGHARRTGITAARGEYIITVDSDDWLDESFLESLAECAAATGADIVSGGITVDKPGGYWEKTCYGTPIHEGDDKLVKFWGEKIVFMNNKIIRRSLHEKVPYCTRRFIEDTPVIIPMLWYANKVAYTEDTGYHYRMQDASLTHKASTFQYALYRALCALDLIAFFQTNDKAFLEKMPIVKTLQQQLAIMKSCKPSDEELHQHLGAWLEFSKKILLQ